MDEQKDSGEELRAMASDARKYVWMGAIPLLVNLHPSEVSSLPAPPPFLGLAPRNGYLPLLSDAIRTHFLSALPPGSATIWFDFAGLPLKWHIPTGVLYDLLCAEPERPWTLTVHFTAYPSELLANLENEEAVKWKFINAMKEASYLMYGNTKSVMNMSQVDQYELWKSVVQGNLESFDHVSNRLRPVTNSGRQTLRHATSGELESEDKIVSRLGSESSLPLRIPIRFYIRRLEGKVDLGDLYDTPNVSSWDELVYMTRPIHFLKEKGSMLTLRDALIKIVPHLFLSTSEKSVHEKVTEGAHAETHPGEEVHHLGRRSYSDVIRGDAGAEGADGSGGASKTSETSDSKEGFEPKEEAETPGTAHDPEGNVLSAREEISQELLEGDIYGSSTVSPKNFNGFIRIQGIQPNLDIPVEWLARNLCAPDQFIHVCVCTWLNPHQVS